MERRYEIDMSKGSILKNMILFAIPLMLSNILQLLYNAADTIVVGQWGGPECLAAVGSTGTVTGLLINFFVGLSVGVAVAISRKYGAGDMYGLNKTAHTAITISIIAGAVSMVLGEFFCYPILELMGTPDDVINLAALYLRIIFLGTPAQLIYNFGAAILRSVGDTKRPLYILSATGIVNVCLNLLLVIGFGMDVAGVAIATVTAHYLSAAAVMYILLFSGAPYKISFKKLKIHMSELKEIVSVGVPAGIQSSIYCISNMAIQSSVNSFGTATMAGRAAANNVESFAFTSMNSFYQATMTSVGQNVGAKQEKRIYNSIWIGMACAIVAGAGLGFILYIFGPQLLGLYVSSDTSDYVKVIEEGMLYMTIVGLPYFLCGIQDVMTGTLRGMGHSKMPALSSFIGACLFRIAWINFVLPFNRSTWFLYLCWPISWILVIIMHVLTFFAVRKKTIEKMYKKQ